MSLDNTDGQVLVEQALPPPLGKHRRQFSVFRSTEENNKSDDDQAFYGPYAHIRKTLDYSYHRNYTKERQFLQDSIIDEFLEDVSIKDVNGNVCTTPTEPWLVFTAGAMGAGKGHTIHELVKKGRFPLLAFVTVDPDEIRRRFPEFGLYAEKCPALAGEHSQRGWLRRRDSHLGWLAGRKECTRGWISARP